MAMGRGFIESGRIPFNDRNSVLGTLAQASPEPVAIDVRHQPGLAIDDLDRPLGTRMHAQSATVALGFIDLGYLSRWHGTPQWDLEGREGRPRKESS
jgi:hypothetical protein